MAAVIDRAWVILHAYGAQAPTPADTRAYVAVLDRMGAFTSSERQVLIEAGILR